MTQSEGTIRVAVTQAAPEWLDLEKTVEKTCRLIEEAATNGAKLVTFPECWIPGYPAWIWSRAVDFEFSTIYIKNSLKIDSPQMAQIRACAAKNHINVSLGFSENHNHSLYISQATIGSDGEILMARRKLMPSHMERTVFGDASGNCLNNVVEVPGVGRIGALACWEHAQPLLKYNTILQRETFHVAAWPPVFEHPGGPGLWSMSSAGTQNLSQTYAIESQSFVLHTTTVLTQKGVDRMGTGSGSLMNVPGGGSSAIFGPDGRKLSVDIPETEEGIIYADLDPDDILRYKAFIDVGGHYSRPDILWLGSDNREKKHSRIHEG
ncbi:hypothetical protein MFRU_002g03350 [Monilinia fructicola]|uniref:nitrilase n=1 Tax=Monilinia fructicola TaxID=38448 RepID=A0A5M9K2J7_MONFR|nr:hypothetical protein EYC84_004258 [Monilinia fructicola]KAG4034986.1 hypothetical protein MFRU_002g03350 [Monilinia fructicola]